MQKLLGMTFFLIMLATPLFAQSGGGPTVETRLDQMLYLKGDINAEIGLGAQFPLFSGGFNFKNITAANLKPGVLMYGALDVYQDNNIKMGGSITFSSGTGVNKNIVYMVGFDYRMFYEFHVYSWSFPVGGSAGVELLTYGDLFAFNLAIKPEAGAFYNINSKWSVGLKAQWDIILQPVWSKMAKSRVGNFLEVALCGRYYF